MYIDTGIKVYSLLGKEQKVGRKENLIKAKEIYKNTMQDIISDKNKWKEFIEFSSKFYKYSFTENLLMFGQDKNVTMCATLDEWNSIGRWVKPHSTGLRTLKDVENDVQLEYVFDVKDTYARRDIPNAYTDQKLQVFKWKATEQEAIQILKNYLHYEDEETLENVVTHYIATELDNSGLLLNLSEEEEMQVLKPEFLEILAKSTAYQVANRCGIKITDTSDLFTGYEEMANPIAINILGNCVSHCSSELLRIIEYKIKQIKKEELKYGYSKQIWNNNQEESKRTIPNEVQRTNDRNNINGENRGEGTRNLETERDNRETSERTKPSTKNERVYSDGEIQSNDRESGRGIIATDVGRENLKDNEGVEQETTPFSMPKKEVSEELITKILSEGGNTQGSLDNIKNILSDDTLTIKEQIPLIKNEYVNSGAGVPKKYSWMGKPKGLEITDFTTNATIVLTWADVVNRTKSILGLTNEQLGFETLFNLSYQQNDIVEKDDNSKYDFINDLIGKKIFLEDREYQVSKLKLDTKEIELYDQSIKGWYPVLRVMNLDEFVLEYTNSNAEKQAEDETIENRINYKIDSNEIETRNLVKRTNDNINAIKLLKKIENENRLATAEEQTQLAKYTGWGGLSKVFSDENENWEEQQNELKDILTEEEFENAKGSTLNAFYTTPTIINNMYLGLLRLGFKGGNILEPSARNRKFYRKSTKGIS